MEEKWIGCAAPNFRAGRRDDAKPEAVVIHIIVGSLKSAGNTFLNPNISPHRSAHYGVGRNGTVHRYVREEDTAFHAGVIDRPTATTVKDRARTNPNLYTVGIEHEGHPGDPWPEAQVASSAALVARVTKRWGIACDREHVLMHREIRASKTCPGLNEADMVAIIDRARRVVIPDGDAAVPAPGTRIVRGYPRAVRIAKPVNLRVGTPSVRSPIVTVLPVGAKVEVVAQIVGPNPIEGQSWWYELPDERGFFWAGAVQSSF